MMHTWVWQLPWPQRIIIIKVFRTPILKACMGPCAGQSQPPNHLSMFLEVTEPQVSTGSWSYFVSHRLSVVNQKDDSKSVTKESQNRQALPGS